MLAKKLMLGSGSQSKPYLEFVSSTPMTIKPKYKNSGVTLQYSLDGTSWTTISSEATTPSANVIYFRGQATGTKSLTGSVSVINTWTFTNASNLAIYGKFDRLIQDSLGGNDDILSIGSYCFRQMFYRVTALVYIDKDCLPATTVSGNCYQNMFYGCTSLTTAPSLPATTVPIYCYQAMFSGCTSLTTAPSLPATTVDVCCYSEMFKSCTSLTTLPNLPASILKGMCYNDMFLFCNNIKLSTTRTGIYDTVYRVPASLVVNMDNAPEALTGMFTGTGGTFKGTPDVFTTYYTENTPV